jgi:ATP-binding protein involved in chromosome partitioning
MNLVQHTLKTKLPSVKNIIMVASGKGGVGKSTVATGIALSLAREGYLAGIFDADAYGPSVPTLFNISEYPTLIEGEDNKIEPFHKIGLKVMSIGFFSESKQPMLWRGPLATKNVIQLIKDTDWGTLDYLIIDTPPGIGDIHMSLLQHFDITGIIIVTTPQNMALCDVQKAIRIFNTEQISTPIIGIIENMSWFSPTKHPHEKYFLFGEGGGEFIANEFNVPLLGKIPLNENLCICCDEGKLLNFFSNPIMEEAYIQLIRKLITNIND